MRGTYTAQIMRLCARLLINLRKTKPLQQEQSFWNYLKPEYFDDIVKATLMKAAVISDDNLEKPSNARKLGFDIKKIINGKIGLSIMNSYHECRRDAEDLLKTMEIFWGTKVAKLATVLLEERKYNKHTKLPVPEDIEKLNRSLEDTITNLDLNPQDCSYDKFLKVAEAVSAKLVLYNRRRTGELQAISLKDYVNRKQSEAPEHLVGDLSSFEIKLLETQEVMTVRGKTGRGVPVIIPAVTKDALRYLTDNHVRKLSGIQTTNNYIFASKGDGVVRAYDCLAKACRSANLQDPELVTSTSLRKYMATVTQVLDLKGNEMEWVINHLGHTMDVHKIHYRSTSDIVERSQIAKLLLIQDNNKVGLFKNKRLQEIQMEDIVFGESTESIPEIDREHFEKDLLDESERQEIPEPKHRKKATTNAKSKWLQSEEEEIQRLFAKHFDSVTRPNPKDCVKAIKVSKAAGGVIWKRKKDVLKKKLFRMIDKIKRGK